MKNNNVKKINTIGKVSRIVIIIGIVLLSISSVLCIFGGIASIAAAPVADDLIKLSVDGNAQIEFDTNYLPFGEEIIKIKDFNMFGIKYKLEHADTQDGIMKILAEFGIDEMKFNMSYIFIGISIACFIGALVIALFIVAMVFAYKLAKALENCNSPFESSVIRSMKRFGFSLIPWAIIKCLCGSSVLTVILFVIIILLFVYIFSYGAQLQKESDDTV